MEAWRRGIYILEKYLVVTLHVNLLYYFDVEDDEDDL